MSDLPGLQGGVSSGTGSVPLSTVAPTFSDKSISSDGLAGAAAGTDGVTPGKPATVYGRPEVIQAISGRMPSPSRTFSRDVKGGEFLLYQTQNLTTGKWEVRAMSAHDNRLVPDMLVTSGDQKFTRADFGLQQPAWQAVLDTEELLNADANTREMLTQGRPGNVVTNTLGGAVLGNVFGLVKTIAMIPEGLGRNAIWLARAPVQALEHLHDAVTPGDQTRHGTDNPLNQIAARQFADKNWLAEKVQKLEDGIGTFLNVDTRSTTYQVSNFIAGIALSKLTSGKDPGNAPKLPGTAAPKLPGQISVDDFIGMLGRSSVDDILTGLSQVPDEALQVGLKNMPPKAARTLEFRLRSVAARNPAADQALKRVTALRKGAPPPRTVTQPTDIPKGGMVTAPAPPPTGQGASVTQPTVISQTTPQVTSTPTVNPGAIQPPTAQVPSFAQTFDYVTQSLTAAQKDTLRPILQDRVAGMEPKEAYDNLIQLLNTPGAVQDLYSQAATSSGQTYSDGAMTINGKSPTVFPAADVKTATSQAFDINSQSSLDNPGDTFAIPLQIQTPFGPAIALATGTAGELDALLSSPALTGQGARATYNPDLAKIAGRTKEGIKNAVNAPMPELILRSPASDQAKNDEPDSKKSTPSDLMDVKIEVYEELADFDVQAQVFSSAQKDQAIELADKVNLHNVKPSNRQISALVLEYLSGPSKSYVVVTGTTEQLYPVAMSPTVSGSFAKPGDDPEIAKQDRLSIDEIIANATGTGVKAPDPNLDGKFRYNPELAKEAGLTVDEIIANAVQLSVDSMDVNLSGNFVRPKTIFIPQMSDPREDYGNFETTTMYREMSPTDPDSTLTVPQIDLVKAIFSTPEGQALRELSQRVFAHPEHAEVAAARAIRNLMISHDAASQYEIAVSVASVDQGYQVLDMVAVGAKHSAKPLSPNMDQLKTIFRQKDPYLSFVHYHPIPVNPDIAVDFQASLSTDDLRIATIHMSLYRNAGIVSVDGATGTIIKYSNFDLVRPELHVVGATALMPGKTPDMSYNVDIRSDLLISPEAQRILGLDLATASDADIALFEELGYADLRPVTDADPEILERHKKARERQAQPLRDAVFDEDVTNLLNQEPAKVDEGKNKAENTTKGTSTAQLDDDQLSPNSGDQRRTVTRNEITDLWQQDLAPNNSSKGEGSVSVVPFEPALIKGYPELAALPPATDATPRGETVRGLHVEVDYPGPQGAWVGAKELGDTLHTALALFSEHGARYAGKINILADDPLQSSRSKDLFQRLFPDASVVVHTPPNTADGRQAFETFFRQVKSGRPTEAALGHPFDATRIAGQNIVENPQVLENFREALINSVPENTDMLNAVKSYLGELDPRMLDDSVPKAIVFTRQDDGFTSSRNTSIESLTQTVNALQGRGLTVVVMGPNIGDMSSLGVIDGTEHWRRVTDFPSQGMMYQVLQENGVEVAIGQMSGAMDLIAFSSGIPILELGAPFRMGMLEEALGDSNFKVIDPGRGYNAASEGASEREYAPWVIEKIGQFLDGVSPKRSTGAADSATLTQSQTVFADKIGAEFRGFDADGAAYLTKDIPDTGQTWLFKVEAHGGSTSQLFTGELQMKQTGDDLAQPVGKDFPIRVQDPVWDDTAMPTADGPEDYFEITTLGEVAAEYRARTGQRRKSVFNDRHDGFAHLIQNANEKTNVQSLTSLIDALVTMTAFGTETDDLRIMLDRYGSLPAMEHISKESTEFVLKQFEHNAALNGISVPEFSERVQAGDLDLLLQRPMSIPMEGKPR